jgi:hypothetical protein
LQKCNGTILLSLHGKPGISNVCGYRLLDSFTVIDSFRSGESHTTILQRLFFNVFHWCCSVYPATPHFYIALSQENILTLSYKQVNGTKHLFARNYNFMGVKPDVNYPYATVKGETA